MFKKVATEAKRTFFVSCIHTAFLLFIDDNLFDKGTEVKNYNISGIERIFSILNYHISYFLGHIFAKYVGFAVIAIHYYLFVCACLEWLFPRPKSVLKYGMFGELTAYSQHETQILVKSLRLMRMKFLKKKLYSHFDTCLTPTDVVYLKTVKLDTLSKTEADFRPNFTHQNVSMLYKIYDPRGDFEMFGTTYDDDTLSLVIFNQKFNRDKDFFLFAMKWTTDIVQGVRYLHDQDLYHLNLQPENILVDFGSKKFLPMESKAVIGNFQNMQNTLDKLVSARGIGLPDCYRPPEALIFGPSLLKTVDAEKCDTWGIGIITLELLTGGMLMIQTNPGNRFSFHQRNDTLTRMLQSTYFCAVVEAAHGGGCTELLQRMGLRPKETKTNSLNVDEAALWIWWVFVTDLLKFDPTIRIGIHTACQHGFMKKAAEVLSIKSFADPI